MYSLLLVGVTMVWGWTFVVVRDAVALYGVLPFLTLRFALAALALAPYTVSRVSRRTLAAGTGIGLVLALAYLFQTAGLLFTSPTNSGLLTGLFVVFAPLADFLFFGARPSRPVLVAVLLSLVGIGFLVGGGPNGANLGDVFTLLCAGALGLHIALLSRYAARHDAAAGLAFVQVLSIAVLRSVLAPLRAGRATAPGGMVRARGDGAHRLRRGVLDADLRPAANLRGQDGGYPYHGARLRRPLRILARR